MKQKVKVVLISIVLTFFFHKTNAQCSPFLGYESLFTQPLSYTVFKTTDSLKMDGKAIEVPWLSCAWSDYFVDIEGYVKPKPAYHTRFKMLWSNDKLYIYAELEEPHIWATVKEHDQVVFHDNDFEVFIDPDGDTQSYFEIEINALKTVFDLFLAKPYRNGGSALISWNAQKLDVGVSIDGTMNNPGETDNRWSVEMAIPFKSISLGNTVQIPVDGTTWRINFSRVEWDVEIKDHAYQKKLNPSAPLGHQEHNWVWSPQGLIDMHYPERWGYAVFSSKIAKTEKVSDVAANENQLRNYLWLVYYKQVVYMSINRSYANDLFELGMSEESFLKDGDRLLLETLSGQYSASIEDMVTGESWQINQLGIVSKKTNAKTNRP